MMQVTSSSGRVSGSTVSASLSVTVALVAVMAIFSQCVAAGPGPLVVRGYIRDDAGNPFEGASVTINIRYASNNTIRSTLYDTSDDEGFYSVTFTYSQWDEGDKIEVISTWHSMQEKNSKVATSNAIQYVNITYPFVIDEYGSGTLGILIAGGFVGAVAIVLLVGRKHQRKAN